MKVIVPDHYKEFKCIAGACEDTCCAGWEVDVDEDSYRFYKEAGGEIGKRLADVMIPKAEGDGCSFRLTPDKRCPFLNEKNLCDIYTALGEDALCDTCTYFPRFVHDYGSLREMGTAPSCFTAAQIMVEKQGETGLVSFEDKSIPVQPNDICPEAFFMLQDLRKEIFEELWDENGKRHLHERLVKILEMADEAQKELTEMLDVYEDAPDKSEACGGPEGKETVSIWLEPFPGMEIINKDWLRLLEMNKAFCGDCRTPENIDKAGMEFESNVTWAEGAFREFLFYYFFRYIPEAVHDGRLMCAVKTGIVAYLTVKRLCVALYHKNKGLTKDEIADVFHLYSRQIEHSEVNFEHYRTAYDRDEEYAAEVLKKMLRE